MKKSEIYFVAMCSVIEDRNVTPAQKLEIIERLMMDKQLAEWSEKNEEDKKDVQ